MDFFYGMGGFLGFEMLRIYRRRCVNLPILPDNELIQHIIILIGVSIFSGTFAHIIAHGNKLEALYLGFSAPATWKVFRNAEYDGHGHGVRVDDIKVGKPSFFKKLIIYFKEYFKF